jgi:hypothetical protein
MVLEKSSCQLMKGRKVEKNARTIARKKVPKSKQTFQETSGSILMEKLK